MRQRKDRSPTVNEVFKKDMQEGIRRHVKTVEQWWQWRQNVGYPSKGHEGLAAKDPHVDHMQASA